MTTTREAFLAEIKSCFGLISPWSRRNRAVVEDQDWAGIGKTGRRDRHAAAATGAIARHALELNGRFDPGVARKTAKRNRSRHGSSPS
jgi:hypothetical protein